MKIPFDNSFQYWNDRYKNHGNSGAGSYGALANFKADILNNFVNSNNIRCIIEFGCGDGNQLSLSSYRNYIGIDISNMAIELCKQKFSNDTSKEFYTSTNDIREKKYDLSLSLDVIYHLVEDEIFLKYIENLFHFSHKFVVIYSSNCDLSTNLSPHVKHRKFTNFVPEGWKLINIIKNKFPYDADNPLETSFSDFYFYEKI